MYAHHMYNNVVWIEFDPVKNRLNRAKHQLDLADAEPVFRDPYALTITDSDYGEARTVSIGADNFGRVLVVVYTWRGEATIRIISARFANAREREVYEAHR